MKLRLLLMTLLLTAGCSGPGDTVTSDVPSGDAQGTADDRAEPEVSDLGDNPDAVGTEDLLDLHFPDLPDTAEPGCEPGEGCFLDKCSENADCLSGWCVEHMGEGVCSQSCQDECPPGWECRQVAGTVPDVVYICVSNVANLCRPCSTGADCKSVGGAEDVCVDYGDEGAFCGGTCLTDAECPWGFSCIDAFTVTGVATRQCVADAGVCPCTGKSVALALSTPCEVVNEFGTCSGQRVCTDDGLSECDASVPAEETCDGVDNDCDGDVDESTCDDGNECTADTCLGEAGCDHAALDEGECKDGNPCTVADHCEAGVCVGDPVICDDENPCTACTLGDHCVDGECVGTEVECDCTSDTDCEALEDGNLCNGTLFCNTQKVPFQCQVEPGTEVTCPAPAGADAPCLEPVCNPGTGQCSFAPANDDMPCEDGDLCTLADACQEGECTAGPTVNCNDGNPCTDDSCAPDQGCLHAPNSLPCSDGNVCTVGDTCVDAACKPGTEVLSCDDANPCTDDTCDTDKGCLHKANVAPCDDGNLCTSNDQCSGAVCKAGAAVDCDDGNVCTNDSCDPATGCGHKLATGPCDDGDACTSNDKCLLGECAGTPTDCDDGNPCTDDLCQEGAGCVHTANASACDDGNACTKGDHCSAGSCVSGELVNCDDDNVCTTDTCAPATGCTYTFNKAPCTDDNVCTLKDQCSLGECVGSGTLACADLNPCTDDGCNPEVGCEFVPNQGACDDGNACTGADFCNAGSCKPGDAVDCNDSNPCTDDACDPQAGCIHSANTLPCDDGNACTLDDTCAGEACVGGPALDCSDGNVCTNDGCNPASGCFYTFNQDPCDDDDPCTVTDQCAGGFCVGTGELDCDDQVVCTADSCEEGVGCKHVVTVDYQSDSNNCGECGNVCAQDKECSGGECVLVDPWVGAGASWKAAGKYFGRYTWSQAGIANNGRFNATSFCTGKGGTLARPNSQDEWDKLYQNLPNDSYGYWIDGHNNYVCGSATPGNPKAYQYGQMYCPTGTSQLYTGCNCTPSEQGIVVYRYTGSSPFDGCQYHAGQGNLGAMDENLDYGHGGIHGFVCEKN